MTPDELWRRYAALWSIPDEAELDACLHEACSYCDPNGLVHGRAALVDYMAGFRRAMPGARFRIEEVAAHHGRSSSLWTMRGADDAILQRGRSFATVDERGRLRDITGFFG
jgi:hypothetical protein